MGGRNIFNSFNYAISGIIYGIKTQRNLKIHCAAALGALLLSLFYDFTRLELLILVFTIVVVFIAELINTAIEKVVDMIVDTYHPLAKIAKDVAAGAVLIASVNALVVAYILFFSKPRVIHTLMNLFERVRETPVHIAFISLIIVLILIFLVKALYGKGLPLHGGVVSGHAAIAFSITTAISFITKSPVIITMSLLLSFMVAQSRVEGRIHSVLQVTLGALLGMATTLLLFSLANM
ncbi:diacylglycerol kinase [Petroclostridium sp. X23]|uniref:diacylglycerol kinase n=1 Tax=Petroclostridium sp. X23 TaxID=3045146 RepID=UPI0024ADD61D|nr:diacylglycerol kinase [Petroclostridium sp. X23]WHH59576.1 diacylglycerol kinase [Petroclostridium sp. X23]